MTETLKMYIDGQWVPSLSGETRAIINPADQSVIATVYEGNEHDADQAVQAARKAFDSSSWKNTTAQERAKLLFALADVIEKEAHQFAELETRNSGKPLREAETDVNDCCACFRYYAGLAAKPHGQTYDVPENMQAFTVREPIGVCAQIVPWNYPLLMAAWKLAPALAAGNTVVFKPAEITPLTVIRLFELIEQVGFPKGVANLVLGAGETVGDALSGHESVDKVAFTGGTVTGKKIAQTALGNLKKVSLELGGKSPNIVFADADFETAVDYALEIGEKVMTTYRSWQKDCSVIGDVRGLGAMVGLELVKNQETKEPNAELVAKVIQDCAQNGLIIESAGIYHNVIRFLAPLVITDAQLECGLNILERAIRRNM